MYLLTLITVKVLILARPKSKVKKPSTWGETREGREGGEEEGEGRVTVSVVCRSWLCLFTPGIDGAVNIRTQGRLVLTDDVMAPSRHVWFTVFCGRYQIETAQFTFLCFSFEGLRVEHQDVLLAQTWSADSEILFMLLGGGVGVSGR